MSRFNHGSPGRFRRIGKFAQKVLRIAAARGIRSPDARRRERTRRALPRSRGRAVSSGLDLQAMADVQQLQPPNDDWQVVAPPEGVLFLAERKGDFASVRPNLSAALLALQPGASIEDAADAALDRLRDVDPGTVLTKRQIDDDTSVVQQVEFSTTLGDASSAQLAQISAIVDAPVRGGEGRAVMCVMLTAEASVIDEHGPDFQAFLESAHVF